MFFSPHIKEVTMLLNYNHEKHTGHFRFIYTDIDKIFAEKMADYIETKYIEICRTYNISIKNIVYDFYVCKDVEDYITAANKTKESYQDWMVGWADIGLKRLCVLSPTTSKETSDKYHTYITQIIVHEIIHIAFDSICSNIDEVECWLAEGIALYCANQIDITYISSTQYPNIKEISGKGDCDNFYNNGGYDYAGIYVWYFIEKYGINVFKKAYEGTLDLNTMITSNFECEAIKKYIALFENQAI